ERRPHRSEIAVLDAAGARLGLYLENAAPAEITGAVREIVEARVELAKLEEQQSSLREQLADAAQRATELRASLHAIEKTPSAAQLQKKLLEQLTHVSSQTEQLATKLGEQTAAMSELRARIAERLRDVRFEESPR